MDKTIEQIARVNLENTLSKLSKECWGDNAVEYLVGVLSSLTSDKQLSSLIENLQKYGKYGK